MNLDFLKPNGRKISAFLIIFFVAPFPIFMYIDPGGSGWYPMPFLAPFLFLGGLLWLIFEQKFYSEPQFAVFILHMVVYPVVSYLLACLSILVYDKKKKKQPPKPDK